MSRTVRVLTVLASTDVFERIRLLLSRTAVEVNRAPGGWPAVAMATAVRYDLIIAQYPLPDLGLGELLHGLRHHDSPSHSSPLLILTRQDRLAEIEPAGERNGFQSLSLSASDRDLRSVFSAFIGAARRHALSISAWVALDDGLERQNIACRIRNLSKTGAFLQLDRRIPIGAEIFLSFGIAGDSRPILAAAEVVRHADPRIEGVTGVGVSFRTLLDDGSTRLQRHFAVAQDNAQDNEVAAPELGQ